MLSVIGSVSEQSSKIHAFAARDSETGFIDLGFKGNVVTNASSNRGGVYLYSSHYTLVSYQYGFDGASCLYIPMEKMEQNRRVIIDCTINLNKDDKQSKIVVKGSNDKYIYINGDFNTSIAEGKRMLSYTLSNSDITRDYLVIAFYSYESSYFYINNIWFD